MNYAKKTGSKVQAREEIFQKKTKEWKLSKFLDFDEKFYFLLHVYSSNFVHFNQRNSKEKNKVKQSLTLSA